MQSSFSLIRQCLDELEKRSTEKQSYQDYYDGEHEILTDYDMQDSRSNRKLIFNFPRKFVDNETGYLLGKPVNFISKSDNQQAVDCIDRNTAHWSKEHNIALRKSSEIFGEAYEVPSSILRKLVSSDGSVRSTGYGIRQEAGILQVFHIHVFLVAPLGTLGHWCAPPL